MDVSTSVAKSIKVHNTSTSTLTSHITSSTGRSTFHASSVHIPSSSIVLTETNIPSTLSSVGPTMSSAPDLQHNPVSSTFITKPRSSNATMIIVGCVLGSVVTLFILILLFWFLWRRKYGKGKRLDEDESRWRIMNMSEENIQPKPYENDIVRPSISHEFQYSIDTANPSNVTSLGASTTSLQISTSHSRASSDSADQVAFPRSNSRNTSSIPLLQRPVHRPIKVENAA